MGRIILGIALFVASFMFGSGTVALIGLALFAWGVFAVAQRNSTIASFGTGYQYSFCSGKTGIGVSPETRMVKLKEKSNVKEYPFDMIRSWESNLQTGGMVVHGGSSMTGAANVGAANAGQMMRNRQASGFFVATKDLDNPAWRIEMFDKKEQAKWMEIMQQCINES